MIASEREALLLLGYVLYSVGRLERAERVVAGVLRLFPDDREAERLLAAVVLRLGKNAETLAITSRQLADAPPEAESSVMHWLRAEALWSLGRKDEAAEHTALFMRWRERAPEEVSVEPV